MTVSCVVALDVGGTGMKAALVDDAYRTLVTRRMPTPREQGPGAVVERILATVVDLHQEALRRELRVRAAGVVVPGIVDEQRGVAVFAVNIGWRDVALVDLLRARLDLPIAFGHDVRAGGLAEGELGAARGVRDYLFLPIGTGIAGAVVLGGEPYAGNGYAGELGHIVLNPTGPECPCGARGCLETIASAAAIALRYNERTGSAVDAVEVGRRVAAAEPAAVSVWTDAVQALGGVIAGYACVLAPDIVVVGGGLAEAGDTLLTPLARATDSRLPFQQRPKLVPAQLGDQAGVLGAAVLAWRRAAT